MGVPRARLQVRQDVEVEESHDPGPQFIIRLVSQEVEVLGGEKPA